MIIESYTSKRFWQSLTPLLVFIVCILALVRPLASQGLGETDEIGSDYQVEWPGWIGDFDILPRMSPPANYLPEKFNSPGGGGSDVGELEQLLQQIWDLERFIEGVLSEIPVPENSLPHEPVPFPPNSRRSPPKCTDGSALPEYCLYIPDDRGCRCD